MNTRSPFAASLLLILLTQAGCVALNVPSQRFHDPGDQGGVFGAWSSRHGTTHGADPLHMGEPLDSADSLYIGDHWHMADHSLDPHSGGHCVMGGALEADPFDTNLGPDGKPKVKPPEIPWPRFHPVPTQPVFGPKSP